MRRVGLWVVLGAWALLLLGNDRVILYSLDEARNAQCAREMYHRQDWVVPTYNGELRTQKPPLAYYMMMGSFAVLGETPFAARFPMALAGALTIGLVFALGLRYHSVEAGLGSAALLLASVHFQLQMSMSVPDPYLILLVTAALAAFLRAMEEPRPGMWLLLGYTATGLAVLTKGPIGAWLVGAPVLLFLVWKDPRHFFRNVWRIRPYWGIPWVAVWAIPWVVAVQAATDGVWLREFIGYQNVRRFNEPLEGHGGFLGITVAFVVLGMAPATGWLPQALIWGWQQRRQQPVVRLSIAAVVVVVGTFLVAATRLPNYTTPAYPFLALCVGIYLAQVYRQQMAMPRSWRWSALWGTAIAWAVPIGGYAGLSQDPQVAHLAPIALWAAIPALVVGAGALGLWRGRKWGLSAMVLGYVFLAVVGLDYLYPRIYAQNPVSQSLAEIDAALPVVAYQSFNPAFSFELPEIVPVYQTPEELHQYLLTVPAATVLSRGEHSEVLKRLGVTVIYQGADLFERSTTLVLRWQRPLTQPGVPSLAHEHAKP